MVVGYTTTYAISCEFESLSGRGVQHYVIKLVSDLRAVFTLWQQQFIMSVQLTSGLIRRVASLLGDYLVVIYTQCI